MQQEVEALLALQQDDLKIREIEKQLRSLDPQLADFDKKREQAVAALARAEAAVQGEEKKQRELQGRLAQHKLLQERNLHQLEDVKRMREATAATAQVESTRRLMAEDETELKSSRRLGPRSKRNGPRFRHSSMKPGATGMAGRVRFRGQCSASTTGSEGSEPRRSMPFAAARAGTATQRCRSSGETSWREADR